MEGKILHEMLEERKKNYVFGLGAWGKELIAVWPECWTGIIDNNTNISGKNFNGVRVGTLDEYSHEILADDARVFISTRLYYKEILQQLINNGVPEERIVNVGMIIDEMAQKQYFDLPELSHSEQEVFLDVGSLDASTSVNFISWCKGIFKKIYVFEPDKRNFIKCNKILENWG